MLFRNIPNYKALFGIVNQAHLLDQLALYLKRVDPQKPRDESIITKIKNSDGYCSGFTPLFLYAKWLSFNKIHSQSVQRDDAQWLHGVIKKLAKWNGDIDALTQQDKNDFERIINHLEFLQNNIQYMSQHHFTLPSWDNKDTPMRREYCLSGMFTAADMMAVLPEILKEDRLMMIDSHDHEVGIYLKDNIVYFYDSNNLFGSKEFALKDMKGIVEAIFAANFGNKLLPSTFNKPCPLSFVNLQIGQSASVSYPDTTTILAKTSLIKNKMDIDYSAKHADNQTALLTAAHGGDFEAVQYYINNGADVLKTHNKSGPSALESAVYHQHIPMIQLLLDKELEKSPDAIGSDPFYNALTKAIKHGYEDVIRLFMDKILKSTITHNNQYQKILLLAITGAVKVNDTELFNQLMDKANDIANDPKLSAMFFDTLNDYLSSVIMNGKVEIIREYLVRLSKFNMSDVDKRAIFVGAFHEACRFNRIELLGEFEKTSTLFGFKMQDLKYVKDTGYHAIHHALRTTSGADMIEVLMNDMNEKEISHILDSVDKDQNNLLHHVMIKSNEKIMNWLLGKMVQTNFDVIGKLSQKNKSGYIPLHLAILRGDKDLIESFYHAVEKYPTMMALCQSKPISENPKKTIEKIMKNMLIETDNQKNNCLHMVLKMGDVRTLEYLLFMINSYSLGKELVREKNEYGNNCLHIFFSNPNASVAMLKVLMSQMDDKLFTQLMNSTNENDQTPLSLASDPHKLEKNKERQLLLDYLMSEAKRLHIELPSHTRKHTPKK